MPLPPLPREARRLYHQLCVRLHEDLVDRALGVLGVDATPPSSAADKGKDRAFSLSDDLREKVGRLAYQLTPPEHWRHEFPFYVGGIHFVLRSHGPIGLEYVEDAAYFLRQPMGNLSRLRLLFTLGWAPPQTMVSMRPLILFCIKHNITGSALPSVFDNLSTAKTPLTYARDMLQTIEAPQQAIGRLMPQTKEIWLFVASGLPAPYADLGWLSFAAKALLYTLSDLERADGPTSSSYLTRLAGLMQVLLFTPPQRLLTLRLFRPLNGQQMAYDTVSEILIALGQQHETVRMTSLLVLNRAPRKARNAPELCRQVKLANLAAQAALMFHTSEPP